MFPQGPYVEGLLSRLWHDWDKPLRGTAQWKALGLWGYALEGVLGLQPLFVSPFVSSQS